MGRKLCLLLNHLGRIVNWDCDTANVHDGSHFQHLVDQVSDRMVVFADEGLPNPVFSQLASVSARRMELSDADRDGFINVDGRLEESEALLLGLLQNTTRFHDGVI